MLNEAPTLLTQRLILRKPKDTDIQDKYACGISTEILRMYGDDAGHLTPYTYEEAVKWYEDMMVNPLEWAVEYQGKCIGQARLTVDNVDKRARYAVGLFDEKLLSHGLGTEITQAVLEYAFEVLNLHRVDLRVLEYNKRAIACYEKCGFIREGIEREGALIAGKWETDWIMSILEHEYRDLPNRTTIKILTPEHAESFWELRLEGLLNSPESFGSTYEEDLKLPLEAVQARVTPSNSSFILGAFTGDGRIVGVLGFKQEQSAKFKHKGYLWGMYIKPEYRRKGIGKKLVCDAIRKAKLIEGLEQINLYVIMGNASAKGLYESVGFKVYGYEKKAIKYKGRYYDEELMTYWLN